MHLKSLTALSAATMMALAPVAAHASAAQALSVAPSVRAGAATDEASQLEGMGTGAYILGAIAIGLVIYGIIELTSDDGDEPESP